MESVYASDPFAYDFETALASAKTTEPKAGGLAVDQLYWRKHWPDAPTEEGLRRHRRLYGGEGIAEIAESYEMVATAKEAKRLQPAKAKRRRRTSAELVAEILELHDRGLVPAAIADALNVSDRRIKALVAKAA